MHDTTTTSAEDFRIISKPATCIILVSMRGSHPTFILHGLLSLYRVELPLCDSMVGFNWVVSGVMGGTQPPGISVYPETSPYGPSSQLSSPPVFQREIRSEATGDRGIERSIVGICCTVLLNVYVLV